MKDVKDILLQSRKKLRGPLSQEWLSEYFLWMEFVTTNTYTNHFIEAIKKEKEDDYASLSQNLQSLFKDGNACLQHIEKQILNSNTRAAFKPQIQALLQAKVDHKKIADPFFKLETVYLDYIAGFSRLLENISQTDANAVIKKYITIDSDLNSNLSFSPFLRSCKQNLEILSGRRTKAVWNKWDLLLQWIEWTKNGISPTNPFLQKNMCSMFRNLNISEAVQCCMSFFLKRLANMQTVTADTGICLKALELFLDQDDQYWIIAHCGGEKGEKREFFIKKLQREAKSYALLKLLLKTEPYSSIEFPGQSHTLGELGIKNELKKVFFPHKKFAGAFVKLSELDVAINASGIVKYLSSTQEKRKHRPSFDNVYYFRSPLVRV